MKHIGLFHRDRLAQAFFTQSRESWNPSQQWQHTVDNRYCPVLLYWPTPDSQVKHLNHDVTKYTVGPNKLHCIVETCSGSKTLTVLVCTIGNISLCCGMSPLFAA